MDSYSDAIVFLAFNEVISWFYERQQRETRLLLTIESFIFSWFRICILCIAQRILLCQFVRSAVVPIIRDCGPNLIIVKGSEGPGHRGRLMSIHKLIGNVSIGGSKSSENCQYRQLVRGSNEVKSLSL